MKKSCLFKSFTRISLFDHNELQRIDFLNILQIIHRYYWHDFEFNNKNTITQSPKDESGANHKSSTYRFWEFKFF